jgi:Tol biopolymer transport system component
MFRDQETSPPADAKWKHAYEVFERALELPASERRAFARSVTRDGEVLRLVLTLIDHQEEEAGDEAGDQDGHGPDGAHRRAGDRIGRYEIVGKLGQGGMGCVYSARDTDLGRRVALKVLPPQVAATPAASERLVREAKAASALNHPHIVTVYEVIRGGSDVAIAMELVEGEALRRRCGTPQPIADVIHWGRQIAEALAAAHSRGIVHRDIKPENLMVRADGHIKLLDFGLARSTIPEAGTGPAGLSGPGGTLNYMSPEQIHGERATSASDVFSLGIVIFELASGTHPFYRDSPLDTAHAIANSELKEPSARNPSIPPALSSMLLAMLAKEPRNRPSAAQVEQQLSAIDRAFTRRGPSRVRTPVALLLAVCVAGVGFWLARTQIFVPAEPVFTQITTRASDQGVTTAALSPDGRNLAFAVSGGPVQLRRMSDGSSQALGTPGGLRVNRIAWFANGSKLLLSGWLVGDRQPGIWELPVQDGEARLLFQDAMDAVPSPDGTRIAMTRPNETAIWVGDASGGSRRLVQRGAVNASFSSLVWSPDSKRVSYQRQDYEARRVGQVDPSHLEKNYEFSFESVEVGSGRVVASARDVVMSSACVLPDGRVLFLRWTSFEKTLNQQMWELRTDPRTGKILGRPRQLTHSENLQLSSISAANDGKQAVVVRSSSQRMNIYLADLPATDEVPRFLNIRRLTNTEADDFPHAWASDQQTVVFESNRNGKFDLFRQNASLPEAEPLVLSPGNNVLAQYSPDGKWVLYCSMQPNRDRILMRVPAGGGQPEPVPISGKLDEFQCALRAGARCVLRSVEDKAFVYRDLDPVRGAGRELARTAWSPPVTGDWAVSPDGTEVAIPNHDPRDKAIRLVPLRQNTPELEETIKLHGLANLNGPAYLNGLSWTSDGRGWYVCVRTRLGGLLVYADRQGRTSELLESLSLPYVVTSRDGRRVAFPQQTGSSNAWVVRGF